MPLRRVSCVVLTLACGWAAVAYANKAGGNASAIVRWRELIQSVARGENVYNEWTKDGSFPYPPIAGILLWPLTQLPPVATALVWFGLKITMAAAAISWSARLAVPRPGERFSLWQLGALVLLASRPLLSDLQHGNINILILFLCTAGLIAFRQHRDVLAGSAIALAGAIKVTPLLFIPYFAWKGQWRVVLSSLVALALFWLFVPGIVLGFGRNVWLIRSWSGAMIEPYVIEGKVETIQTNQSLPGMMVRLLTECPGIEFDDGTQVSVNWLSLSPTAALWIVKLTMLSILAWIAWLARGRAAGRSDPRLALEYSLI